MFQLILPSSGLWEENAVLNSSVSHTKGNSTGDGEFDRYILLSDYTTEKFIPAMMLHMSIDLAELGLSWCRSHINVDIALTLMHLLHYFQRKKALYGVFKQPTFSPAQSNGAHHLMGIY